jgi:predicted phosphate transport protein (TIGR00153 family)
LYIVILRSTIVMAREGLLGWFEKRRRSKTLTIAHRQMTLAIDTVSELERALAAFAEGRAQETLMLIDRLFEDEVEIDELRRAVLAELTRGTLPSRYREDLRGLVERLDRMADHVKDSARILKILVDVGETLPQEVVDEFVTIGTALRKEAMAMGHCIEMIGVDPAKVRDAARNVDFFEAEIDDRYVFIKMRLVQHSKTMSAALLVAVWDLVDYIERAADVCVQTADYLRTLAAAESTG